MPPKKDDKVRSSKSKHQSGNDSSSTVVPSTSVSFEHNSIFLPAGLDCGGEKRQKGKAVKKQSDISKSRLVSCVTTRNRQGIVDNKESTIITPAPHTDHCYSTSSCVEDLLLARQNILLEERITVPAEAVNSYASRPASLVKGKTLVNPVKGKTLVNPVKGKSLINLGSAVSLSTLYLLCQDKFF